MTYLDRVKARKLVESSNDALLLQTIIFEKKTFSLICLSSVIINLNNQIRVLKYDRGSGLRRKTPIRK